MLTLSIAYAVGTVAGFLVPSAAFALASVALPLLGLATHVGGRRGARRLPLSPQRICLSIGLLCGLCNAAAAGRTVRQACPTTLATGDRVEAEGVVANPIALERNARQILRLSDVAIRTDDRVCHVEALVVRLTRRNEAAVSGMRVRIRGEWVRRRPGAGLPRRIDDQGLIVGVVIDDVGRGRTSPAVRSRGILANRLTSLLPADVAPTGLALILAERDDLDPELRRRFAAAGLAHFLAISGMHVGLLAAGLVWLLGCTVIPRRRVIALVLITAYVWMIGAPVAARRALLIFGGLVWARTRGWPARAGDLLGVAALATLIHDPFSLSDPGFQLSFAGFAGVLVGARLTRLAIPEAGGARWEQRLRGVGRGLIISLCALLSTSPFTAWHFGQVTPVAALSHLAGAPLVATSLGSLFGTLTLPGPLATAAAAVATGSIRLLHQTAAWFSVVPYGHSTVGQPGITAWVAWMLVMLALGRVAAVGVARAAIGPLLLAALIVAVAPVARGLRSDHSLLCTLSVGQGDAAILRTRRGHWMVFDGGPAGRGWDAGRSVLLPFLRRHDASRVDVAILSHPDSDHLGGLASLLEAMTVHRVIDSGDPIPSAAYERFLAGVDESDAQWLPAAPGDRLTLDEARITILGPSRTPGREPTAANGTSVSFRLSISEGFRYLNTGDATEREELGLLAAWPSDSLRADLMKVGHHGSRTSSTPAFLRTVSPSIAVISSGSRNPYGHPHPMTLARLDSAAVPQVWRTDRHGTLCVEIDRRGWWRVEGEPGWRRPATVP